MNVTQVERTTYDTLAETAPQYGDFSPAERYLPVFLDIVGESRGTVLDAGCCTGKGGLFLAAQGFDVTLCDLTPASLVDAARRLPFYEVSLWQDLRLLARGRGHPSRTTFDYVVCCDVLEHLPPQFTMLAIDQLLRIAARGLFLSIALVPDTFGVWAGATLHQTVQPFAWWRDAMRELGTVVEARDLITAALLYVRPR